MIDTYKFITGKYDANCGVKWYLRSSVQSAMERKENVHKLVPVRCKQLLTKHELRKKQFLKGNG